MKINSLSFLTASQRRRAGAFRYERPRAPRYNRQMGNDRVLVQGATVCGRARTGILPVHTCLITRPTPWGRPYQFGSSTLFVETTLQQTVELPSPRDFSELSISCEL